MPERKLDGSAGPLGVAPPLANTGTDDVLREANRQLLGAALKANEERDAQTALANAMRELLGKGDAGDRALRSEVELLRSITANVSSALLVLDAQNHPVFINPAGEALFGYALQEIEGALMHQALHHHRRDGRPFPIDECQIEAALTTRTSLRDHADVFVRKDGTFLPVRCDVGALHIAGEPVGAVVEVHDRTVEERADEAKRDFVALIAHDLRTPLTVILAQAQLLQRRLQRVGGSERQEFKGLELIAASARRINGMIERLLEASRLESGVVPLRRALIDVAGLAAQVIGHLPTTEEGQRVEVVAHGSAVVAFADPEQIERVLLNVLNNALKYSPPGRPVRVDVRREADEATVAVVDQGPGISADQLPRLFQRFVRLERRAELPDPGGLGLGLYIVRLIIEAHGGRVWAESTMGTGTTIGFSLPLHAAATGDAVT